MPNALRTRRLSTVLFLDIVGSTAVASDLGDARWRELLGRFQRTVRAELHRYGGHEEDTAGDGLFATFPQPEQGVQAAGAIVVAVQRWGVDVRCGLHFGECEVHDGKLAGLAVHIGARVMSLAGPAEILVTSTVKDLVTGSGIGFEALSAHELKGVPGTWQIFAVRRFGSAPIPRPLTGAEAAERLAAVQVPSAVRRRRPLVIGAAAAALTGFSLFLLFGGFRGHPRAVPSHRSSVSPISPSPTLPLVLSEAVVKVDPVTGRVVTTARSVLAGGFPLRWLAFGEGSVWVSGSCSCTHLVRLDPDTGDATRLGVGGGGQVTVGDHQVWLAGTTGAGHTGAPAAFQVDPVSNRVIGTIRLPESISFAPPRIAVGGGYVWVTLQGLLFRGETGHSHPLDVPHEGGADVVTAFGQEVWMTDLLSGVIRQVDPNLGSIERTITPPFAADAIAVGPAGLWVANTAGHVLFQIDQITGDPGQPISVGAGPISVAVGTHAVWVANRDDHSLSLVDPRIGHVKTFPVPGSPVALAVDPRTDAVWAYLL
jgi:class 3 adenylate cyclase/streptogramin lyase